MLDFGFYTVLTLFILVCTIMMLLVLIQKGRGGGLASAFGGAGANTAFGSKTGDVLTWATSVVFGIFLILAVALNLMADAKTRARPPVPAAITTPAPIPAEAPATAPSDSTPSIPGASAPTTKPTNSPVSSPSAPNPEESAE